MLSNLVYFAKLNITEAGSWHHPFCLGNCCWQCTSVDNQQCIEDVYSGISNTLKPLTIKHNLC